MTLRKELQNDIANICLGQMLVCALIRFPVQVLLFRSPCSTNRKSPYLQVSQDYSI